MARPDDKDLKSLAPFPRGANNIANESTIPPGACRSAINCDFYPGGRFRRRPGHTRDQVVAGGVNSLWCGDNVNAYCRVATELCRYTPGLAPGNIFTGLDPDSLMTYALVNQYVLASDGVRTLRVNPATDAVRSWGLPTPGNPVATALDYGGMDPGTYLVTLTYVDAANEESGADMSVAVDVPANGGILLDDIPQPIDPAVTGVRVYITRANATTHMRYTLLPLSVSSLTIGKQALGRELETQHLFPLPGVTAAAFCSGRLFFAFNDTCVGFTPAHRVGYFNPAEDFLDYGADVTLLAATAKDPTGAAVQGIFVAAGESTYFLTGDKPIESRSNAIYGAGAVPGTLIYVSGDVFADQNVPSQMVPVWLSTTGVVCVGLPTGTVYTPTKNKYAMSVGDRGAAALRERNGIRQLLFTMQPPGKTQAIAAQDTLTITRYKNGISA